MRSESDEDDSDETANGDKFSVEEGVGKSLSIGTS